MLLGKVNTNDRTVCVNRINTYECLNNLRCDVFLYLNKSFTDAGNSTNQ